MKKQDENSTNTLKKRSIFHKIINGIIGLSIGLFILVLIILGFSQTSLFRGILREQVIEIANSSLNGTINIGRIDGTIFTSLMLRDVTVNMKQDTLLKARLIEVYTSPLQIFYKKIYVRKVGISDATISFLKDTSGALNISKLFKATEEDTSKSSFPFKIKLAELQLANINFSLQDEDKKNSHAFYDNLNLSDFRLTNLNLALSANADIDNKDFELYIDKLSLASNVNDFDIAFLKGDFLVNTKRLIIGDFVLNTKRSEMNIALKNEGLNIFGDITKDRINNSKTSVLLDIKNFSFSDLSAVIPSLDYLKGNVEASLNASGNIKQFDIDKLSVNYLDTKLNCKGFLRNLDAGSKMFISADFIKSNLVESNINKLIAGLELPVYKNMDNISIDTLRFEGEPLFFKTKLKAGVNGGYIRTAINLDLRPAEMIYSADILTHDLNLEPIINIVTKLNIEGKISGTGFSPKTLQTNFDLKADGSAFSGKNIDRFHLTGNAANQFANINLTSLAGTAQIGINGGIDLFDLKNPVYNFQVDAEKLDVAAFTGDTAMATNLNFSLAAKGKSFDLDKLSSSLILNLKASSFMGFDVDSTEVNMVIEDKQNSERSIKMLSKFADISLNGRFSLKDISGVLANEVMLLKAQVFEKINQSFPSLNLTAERPINSGTDETTAYFNRDSAYVNYLVEFKDISLFSKIFKATQLDIDGKINGRYESNSGGIKFNLNSSINYFQYWYNNEVLFITGLEGNIDVDNRFDAFNLKDMNAKINVAVERVYNGNNMQNLAFAAALKNNLINVFASFDYETNISGKINGTVDIANPTLKFEVDSLRCNYNKLVVNNSEKISINIFDDKYDIKNLSLVTGSAKFNASGTVALKGEQNLKIRLVDLSLKDILKNSSEQENRNQVDANVNLTADITGNFSSPKITSSLDINDLSFKEKKFGFLKCTADYANKNLLYDVRIVDTASNNITPKFLMTGNLPVDLALASVPKRLLDEENLKMKIVFNEFDMASIGNSVPKISELQGKVNADINFEGTLKKLNRSGYLNVTGCSFFSDANFLYYNAGVKLSFAEDLLKIDEMFLENKSDVKQKGIIKAKGSVTFDGYNVNSAEIRMNGDLTVLTDDSKNSIPALYGELFMGTDGDAVFTYSSGKMFVSAPLVIKKADLVFPPLQSGFRSYNDKYIYKYPVYTDTSRIGKKSNIERIREAITQAAAVKVVSETVTGSTLFDYDIAIKISEDARIVFIVNKEANLRLVAELSGNLKYENIGGILNTFGELKLLEGSTLEFIKNLEATGSIRFESDITNPNLNIVATYKGSYIVNSTTQTTADGSPKSTEEEATIKIKISGTLADLAKNIQKEDNVLIYKTADLLKNESPDKSLGILDAAKFFVTNRFDSQIDKDGLMGSTTTFAGNILGSVLNSYLGDAVKGVDIRTVGSNTKYNVTGKLGNFKYTVGGSSDVFKDLSTANIKIEHPIIDSFLLRFERKQSVIDNNSNNTVDHLINELGLKYRYEF